MYESAYNKLSWGMVFIIFNINLGPINILPNFIGYLLILSGLSVLSEQHPAFEKGKIPAGILVIITLKDIINFGTVNSLQGVVPAGNLWLSALGAVEQLLSLYVIYIICRGIYLVAEARGLEQLMDSSKARFYFYLFINAIILFYTPFSINLSRNTSMFMIIPVLVSLVNALFIMGLCRMARNQLGEGESD